MAAIELRKRVADILSTEHRISATRLRSLSDKDASELREVAAGTLTPQYRVKALNILAATGDPGAGDVLRGALRDTSAHFEVRAAGATLLSRLGGMAAEGALIDGLAAETLPIVQHKIIGGLARIGSEASLRRLQSMVQAMDPLVRDHARFVESVIAYRSGVNGFELPTIEPALRLPAPGAAEVLGRIAPASPEEAHRVIEQTAADSYGVAGDPDTVTMVQCGRRNVAIVMQAKLRGAASDLAAHPAVAGYLALRAEVDGSYSTSHLIMTWPNGNSGAHVSVNRLSGRAEYYGEATVGQNELRFTLDAVRRPGATETTLTGMLAVGRIPEMHMATRRTLDRTRLSPIEEH